MIKEYFTDGLIGLAIVLSLFRTDLVGINNIINYPEVQDIILGQTAAYLPANFHSSHNSLNIISNQKHIDYDFEAFNAWYQRQNVHNLPLFRESRQNDIETFLVSATAPNGIREQFQASPPSTENTTSGNDTRESSSPSLPLESANSFHSHELEAASQIPTTSSQGFTHEVPFCLNSPFPGCDLSKEDLDLIEILWRQDVDLGVGKEVFDQNLRQELEKERQLELVKQQEKQKTQHLVQEREHRLKQDHASKWLEENYMRDGETGEWVRLSNEISDNGSTASGSFPVSPEIYGDNLMTLDQALDYISENVDPNVLNSFDHDLLQNETQEQEQIQSEQFQPQLLSTLPLLQTQDSLEENWNGLENYLNMTQVQNSTNEINPSNSLGSDIEVGVSEFEILGNHFNHSNSNSVFDLEEQVIVPPMASEFEVLANHFNQSSSNTVFDMEEQAVVPPMTSEFDVLRNHLNQSTILLQNATLPVSSVDMGSDFPALTPVSELNNSLNSQPMNGSSGGLTPEGMDWDLGDMGLFSNLTSFTGGSLDDLDLVEVNDFFKNLSSKDDGSTSTEVQPNTTTINLREGMDSLQMLEDDFTNGSVVSVASSSPREDFGDAFDGLEGATGGSDFNGSHDYGRAQYSKISRLSESSDDSGYGYQEGFSSPPSSSPSSSSMLGSPVSSHSGNTSTASNDTEHKHSRTFQGMAVVQQHVAHNHTYNTPPGQVPREVKKYAQKEPAKKGPHSRDQRRAEEMKIPLSIEDIIESPVDLFNEMLTKHKLSEAQLALIRDIRRRGKNKVAAQNCRKRKVGVIVDLADEMGELERTRDRLLAERAEMEREKQRMKEKFGNMYNQIFQSLRNDQGQPYDPNQYSLQQSSDGNIFLVPRSTTSTSRNSTRSGSSSTKDSSQENNPRKRKSLDQ